MMTTTQVSEAKMAIREHCGLDAETRKLIGQTNYDLYYGPSSDEDYPGFTTACEMISDKLSDLSDLWYDTQTGEVLDREPCGWTDEETDEYIEVDLSDYVHFSRRDVIEAIVGRELVYHVS